MSIARIPGDYLNKPTTEKPTIAILTLLPRESISQHVECLAWQPSLSSCKKTSSFCLYTSHYTLFCHPNTLSMVQNIPGIMFILFGSWIERVGGIFGWIEDMNSGKWLHRWTEVETIWEFDVMCLRQLESQKRNGRAQCHHRVYAHSNYNNHWN